LITAAQIDDGQAGVRQTDGAVQMDTRGIRATMAQAGDEVLEGLSGRRFTPQQKTGNSAHGASRFGCDS
jgi:hypothetical protein